ncbi:M23 family metallopeptidase [Aquincola sp. S2]|uniref:M23 family metallopeptidase n=1 Tax=Pseudaquabacterium terrae TaxID=2732868 RepID=A0ABX2EKP2_9BURK|nr:M23 family metallopeptidase [Aquabacterium terrae]NRF69099.1 M23 family metallopeptidase [Aquabacterium terrae]
MQIMITHGTVARTRVLRFSRLQLLAAAAALVGVLVLLSGTVYHFVFLKAVRDGWPVVSDLVRPIVRVELAQRERSMRDSLDAMAQRVGELQARLVQMEALGDRVSGLAGVDAGALKPAPAATRGGGQGGPYLPLAGFPLARSPLNELQHALAQLDERTDLGRDLLTLVESRLLESRLQTLLVPSVAPVDGPIGSGFGVRPDPITGRAALHAGLDFPADSGTPVLAAAGGVVLAAEWHAQYGQLLELDHGKGLVTRYAHLSKLHARPGDLVKRGQRVAEVGNTGRSTGAHLHFEVLVDGAPQDPARFLSRTSPAFGVAQAR